MIRIDPTNWTADFRIARGLAEAFAASGLDDVLFFCVGDPDDLVGRLGPLVGDELLKYYPNVLGVRERPITAATFAERVAELHERFPDKYVIGIEAGYGRPQHLGSVEITDRGLSSIPVPHDMPYDIAPYEINDVTLNVVLRLGRGVGTSGAKDPGNRGSSALAEAALEVGSDDADARGRQKFRPLRPEEVNEARVQKLADTVIDGCLRLLTRIGKQRL